MADAMDGLDSRGYYGLVTNRLELVWAAAMKHMAALERQLAEATIARCRAIAEPCWRTPVEMPRAPEVALRAMETACDAFGDARKQPAFDVDEIERLTIRVAELGRQLAETGERLIAARDELQRQMDHRREKAAKAGGKDATPNR
jgi:hypothetical protein